DGGGPKSPERTQREFQRQAVFDREFYRRVLSRGPAFAPPKARRGVGGSPVRFGAANHPPPPLFIQLCTIPSSSLANTVRKSITTRPSCTRAITGISPARSRVCKSSALTPRSAIVSRRVGSVDDGAAPPPMTDSPSTSSTSIPLSRSLSAKA